MYTSTLFRPGNLATVAIATLLAACGTPREGAAPSRSGGATTDVRQLNPIAPPGLYIADPEVRQMPDGRIYLYGSRDEPQNAWCSNAYHVLSTRDLRHWDVEQFSFATKGAGKQTDYTEAVLYAPDCIYRDGKYYLYYCLAAEGENEGVAVAESPYGPFRDGKAVEGITGIDPSVFIDDDGQAYLFWGQWHARGARLSADMRSIEGEVRDSLLTYDTHFFNEGSSVRKIGDTYYYVYAGHARHVQQGCCTLCYATAKHPLGPYTYRGILIDNYRCDRNVGNNHGCMARIDGRWYLFYHRATHATYSMRKAAVEPLTIRRDGSIDEVEMTTQGAAAPMSPAIRMDAARACQLEGRLAVRVRRPAHDIPVEYLADIRHGNAACWKYYDFSAVGFTHFVCKTWGRNRAGKIEIRLDSPEGRLLGVCPVAPNDGETAYALHETPVARARGRHALALVFKADDGGADDREELMSLEWFTFENRKK